MILKYVLKNFGRRKVRTILMILSLLVSIGLIVTMSATVETVRQSNVDLIASAMGRYDLSISKRDTSTDLFMPFDEVAPRILAADGGITAVYPRLETQIELNIGGELHQAYLLALDPAVDDVGFINVVEGEYTLGNGRAAIFEETARAQNLKVGDQIDVAYSFPVPREVGKTAVAGASQQRTNENFLIAAIVRQDGVTSAAVSQGLIIHLDDAEAWLGLEGRVQSIIATVDPRLYETNNAETAALRVRDIGRNVQAALGDEYQYSLDKAAVLRDSAQGFLAIQALINTYGLMALGVVGLLVYTLVMTNVQEQRRDMAVLRILGGQRNFLFTLVIAEVMVIGLIGMVLGVILGQLITTYVVVPLIEQQMAEVGINSPLTPQLTLTAVLPAIIASAVVLIASSVRPAQEAARTKVMHAINPGVADNIQIEDIAALRERRPSIRLFLGGLALMLIFALIAGFRIVESFGGPALEVTFILLSLGLMVLGLGLMFFITTVPFERLALFVMGLIVPRLTYFAQRNIGRGQTRNTLISLLVLFSGVLPSFLATTLAMENANYAESSRQSLGAPAVARVGGFWLSPEEAAGYRLTTSFRTEQFGVVPGVDKTAAVTYAYGSEAADSLRFRSAPLSVYGLDGNLSEVVFDDLIEFVAGSPAALTDILTNDQGIIISEGLADYLSLSLGERIKLRGEGTDHETTFTIIGIARKIPGFDGFGRSRLTAANGSAVFISLNAFRDLITPLNDPLPAPDAKLMGEIFFTLTPDAVADDLWVEMGERFDKDYALRLRFLEIDLAQNRQRQGSQQVFLLVLTAISFTTAVFGVFAVIFVTIFSRRLEIGMLKAVGMKRHELTGMLIVESITMTLGAALAGITAGASMGYIAFYSDRILSQTPTIFTIDTTVVPFIVILIVIASIIGAAFSARRIVKHRAIEILRM
ncbi:MAG: ABC transporter permease [Ardenticatenaceae bacterium]|nr:ABC transporter permease [Ardenticatenaceae bacterium]